MSLGVTGVLLYVDKQCFPQLCHQSGIPILNPYLGIQNLYSKNAIRGN